MSTRSGIERTIRLATTVDELADAWVFIMAQIDAVGPNPAVKISPVWLVTNDDDEAPRHFEVTVSGMTELHDDEDEGAV